MIEPSLQIGGGNWANKSDKLLGYHKDGANFYADELTFSRNSLGSYTDANGLVQTMPYNLLQQSNTFDTTWLSNGTTETSGQSGYDGSNNAWLLQRNDGLARFVYQTISVTNTSTFSVYAKAGNVNWIYFNNGSGASVYFDLLNGAVGSITGGNTASIQSVGNGWYRCSAILTNGSENRIYPAISNNVVSGLVGANIYIQDAQLNQGSTALPYFATTTRLNLARVDYKDNVNGSLLLEPQRTNLVTYSEQFDNAAWNKSNVTITANATTSPDGTQNADKLVEDSANSTHFTSLNNIFTADGSLRAWSLFVKEGERRYIFITNVTTINNDINCIVFDTRDGVFTNTNNPTYIVTRNVQALQNGWYRIDFTSAVNSAAYDNFYIGISSTSTMSGASYLGDGTSGIYIYGAQLEQSSYATSYIKSEGAATTRLQDSCSMTGISDKIGQTEGTLFAEISRIGFPSSSNQTLISINDGTSNNRIRMLTTAGDDIRFLFQLNGNNVQYDATTGSGQISDINQRLKIAIAYKSGDIAIYINGVLFNASSNTLTFSAALSVYDALDGTSGLNIQSSILYTTRLTNAELAALTTL